MVEAKKVIPDITHPLGRHWDQPSRNKILFDDTHCLMDKETFECLAEHSFSFPSGIYEGKMWRRNCGNYWVLCWYDRDSKENLNPIVIRNRMILIA